MRRRLAAALALAVLAVLTGPAVAWAHGDPDVAALQVGLRAQRVYGGTVDGILGASTRAGIRELERRAGLAVTGRLRPAVRAALGPYGRFELGARALAVPAGGWDAAAVQFRLAWRGFPSGPFTGRYTERVARAVRKFQRWAGLASDGVAGPATLAALAEPAPAPRLALRWPVVGRLTTLFGPRGAGFHTGLDLAAPAGARVAASAPGIVSFAGWSDEGWGNLVVLEHGNGLRTMYAHLARIDVERGAVLPAGTTVGIVGSTGRSWGPHLHFELRLRDAALDPLRALPRG